MQVLDPDQKPRQALREGNERYHAERVERFVETHSLLPLGVSVTHYPRPARRIGQASELTEQDTVAERAQLGTVGIEGQNKSRALIPLLPYREQPQAQRQQLSREPAPELGDIHGKIASAQADSGNRVEEDHLWHRPAQTGDPDKNVLRIEVAMDLADRGRAELLAQVGLVFKSRKQRQDVTKGCAIEAQRFCSQEGREGGQVSDTLDP